MIGSMIWRPIGWLLIGLVYTYRWTLGPLMGGQCRYHPTCSAFAIEAIKEWGPWRGGMMAMRRLMRCHPFAAGGIDEVPRREKEAA